MTMGGREIAYRAQKEALRACARARKLFGMASAQYAAANAVLADATRNLPEPPAEDLPDWR